jgi:small subunit ribosomal protein S8
MDPIGDYINRLKNASAVKSETTTAPYSKTKEAISDLLKKEGYINFVNLKGKGIKKILGIGLAYRKDGSPKILHAKRISKPGRRVYKNSKEIKPVKFGKGILVISTPKGIVTGKTAKKEKVGGEALFEIW